MIRIPRYPVCALIVAWGFSQGALESAQAAHFGLKYGVSISDQFAATSASGYSGPFPYFVGAVRSPSFGLLISAPVGRMRFVPTLVFLEKGGKVNWRQIDYSGTRAWVIYSASPEYLSLEVDVHFTLPVGSANFYLLLSPRLDMHMASHTPDLRYAYGNSTTFFDIAYQDLVGGLGLGLGQDIQVGKHTLFLEARYDRDLTSAAELGYAGAWTGAGYAYEKQSVFNRMFLLQAGIRFGESRAREDEKTRVWPPYPSPP